MKIGMVLHRPMTARGGGTHRVTSNMRKALNGEHEVIACTFSKHGSAVEKSRSVLPFRLGRLMVLQWCSGARVGGLAHDCDALVYPDNLVGIPHTEKPVILYNHAGYHYGVCSSGAGIRKPYYGMFERRMQKMRQRIREDKNIHVITNSQYTARMVREDTGRESTVIYPGVDIGKFRAKGQTKRSGVASVGTFTESKQWGLACDAMTRLELPYTVMGRMLDSKEQAHHDMLRVKYPNVQLVPNASVKKMRDKLCSAKVYLHAKVEDFGISVVEGIAAGCVPVVPDAGGTKETVPVSDLRYAPNNLNAMQEKIERALAGEYDHHLPFLQKHIERYDISVFQKSLLDFVKAVCK